MSDNLYIVDDILKDTSNRSNWKNLIEPYISEINSELRMSNIGKKNDDWDSEWVAFLPEELDINYNWKFKVGDIVTDGEDIMIVISLPEIHPENTDYNYLRVQINGNTYWVMRIDENGNDPDENDPTYYLHNYFNENQIHRVDEETEKKYRKLMEGHIYYFQEGYQKKEIN